jgi:hypothetical protein
MLETAHKRLPFHNKDILVSNYGKDLSKVADFLLSKEQYILDNYPFRSDFGTLLHDNVTTRSGTYNILSFNNECPDLNGIIDYVREQYYKYVIEVGFEKQVKNPGINAWMNVLRNGEKIGFHKHSDDERSFVSATLSVNAENTETIYKKHGEIVKRVVNRPGEFVMFKCDLEHGTTEHVSDKTRITLGIDIFFDKETSKASPDLYNSLIGI